MVNSEGKYFIYRHIRPDKNEPFYIGIGTQYKDWDKTSSSRVVFKRAYDFGRNSIWKNIVDKNSGEYSVDIIECSDSYEYIKEKELYFIELYKRKHDGGILSNLTVGGEGGLGYYHTDKSKRKMSLAHRGKKISIATRRKMSLANKGKIISDKQKLILSKSKLGSKNPQSKRVIDVLSGKIFQTIKEAASYHNVKYDAMIKYLSGKTPNVTTCMYLDKYNNINKNDIFNYILKSSSTKKMVINPKTGKIFKTLRELSREIGVSCPMITKKLSGKSSNDCGYVLLDDYIKYGKKKSIEMCSNLSASKKRCMNIKNNEIFNSYTDAATYCGISTLSFSRKMRGILKNDTNFIPI